jgi:hypothetical protein
MDHGEQAIAELMISTLRSHWFQPNRVSAAPSPRVSNRRLWAAYICGRGSTSVQRVAPGRRLCRRHGLRSLPAARKTRRAGLDDAPPLGGQGVTPTDRSHAPGHALELDDVQIVEPSLDRVRLGPERTLLRAARAQPRPDESIGVACPGHAQEEPMSGTQVRLGRGEAPPRRETSPSAVMRTAGAPRDRRPPLALRARESPIGGGRP